MKFHVIKTIKYIRGYIQRWFRKTFHKEWDVVEHGLHFFQEFADIYGDTINDIDKAEKFFSDFMQETGGWVIVDFLDTDNWDCIRKIETDKQKGLIWFYWQIPSSDPGEEIMHKMAFPFGYYGMCLKFDNVRSIKGKRNRCIGFIVNGYTIRERNVKGFAKEDGWEIKGIDTQSSFFSINMVRGKDNVLQHWRFMNTPISSFWIIPKRLNVRPQDSEKLLYMYGAEKCEKELKASLDRMKDADGLSMEEQRKRIKVTAHEMRTVAESLFKLIMCFHQEEHHYKVNNYDDLTLGDLTGPLKSTIYKYDFEQERINEIPRLANDLSHDSGNPVEFKDLGKLFIDITYFISGFKTSIRHKGHEIVATQSDKPSPHDFLKEQYKSFCFIDEINQTVHKGSGKISFVVKARIGTFVDIFGEKGVDVLCSDGYFRNSKEDGIDILKVWDRDEVIALLDGIYQKVTNECETNGYDTATYSLGISFEPVLKKEENPSHLFTEKEIEDLMRNADDANFNKLVIDEDGVARIIQSKQQGNLYPVSIETWVAGNMYVGKDSSLSALHDSYVLCMHLWLAFLETGSQMYGNEYVPDSDLDEVIEKVKKYYSV